MEQIGGRLGTRPAAGTSAVTLSRDDVEDETISSSTKEPRCWVPFTRVPRCRTTPSESAACTKAFGARGASDRHRIIARNPRETAARAWSNATSDPPITATVEPRGAWQEDAQGTQGHSNREWRPGSLGMIGRVPVAISSLRTEKEESCERSSKTSVLSRTASILACRTECPK